MRVVFFPLALVVQIVLLVLAVGTMVVFVRFLVFLLRGLVGAGTAVLGMPFRMGRRRRRFAARHFSRSIGAATKQCPDPQCGYPNKPVARYCAMCGRWLA
jgi:hypothetical protein